MKNTKMTRLLRICLVAVMAMMCMPMMLCAQENTGKAMIKGVYVTVEAIVDGKTYRQDYTDGPVYVTQTSGDYKTSMFITVTGENLDKCDGQQYVIFTGASGLTNNSEWKLIDNNTMRMEYIIHTSWKDVVLDRRKVQYSNTGNGVSNYIDSGIYVEYHEHSKGGGDKCVDAGDPHRHKVKETCPDCPVVGGYTYEKDVTEEHVFSNAVCTHCDYVCKHPGITTNPHKLSVGDRSAHYYNSDAADNLFDDNLSTKWCSKFGESTTYVDFQYTYVHPYGNYPYPKRLLSYTLTTANDVEVVDAEESYVNRNWQAWTIWGKHEANGTWEVVDRVEYARLPETNLTESEPFYIDTDKSYPYYRITVDEVRGGAKQAMSGINLVFDVEDNDCSICDVRYPDHTGIDKEITYEHGCTYDITQLFTKDANVGDATYCMIQGGTGEGTLNGNILTVDKVGSFRIMMSTEGTGNYLPDCAIAKLTVNKAELANSPGYVAPTPMEGLYFTTGYHRFVSNPGSVAPEYGEFLYAMGDENGTVPTEWHVHDSLPKVFSTPGTYYVWYKATAKGNYKDMEPMRLDCIINKVPVTITAKPHSISYGDEPSNNGFTSKGFIKINNSSSDYFGSDESLKDHIEYYYDYEQNDDVGEYNIYIRTNINEDKTSKRILGNYEPVYVAGKLTVNPRKFERNAFFTFPDKRFVYNGEPQPLKITLIKEDLVEGRDYYITYKRNNVETDDITSAGKFDMFVHGIGNYTGILSGVIVIDKANPVVTAPTPRNLAYSGDSQVLVDAASTNGGTLLYSLDGEQWSEELPQALGDVDVAQTYTVYYKVIGDSNFNDVAPASVTVTINVCAHYGGIATCVERAICDHCHMHYGSIDPNMHDYADDGICVDCGNLNPEAESIILADSDHKQIQVKEDFVLSEVIYTRTLNNGWNPLYVPFQIELTEELLANYDVAYINDFRSYDNDEDGEPDYWEIEIIKLKKLVKLMANHPYVIRPKSDEAMSLNITQYDAKLHCTAAEKQMSVTCSSAYMQYEIKGVYSNTVSSGLDNGNYVYAINKRGEWQKMDLTTCLAPFRLYLTLKRKDGSPIEVNVSAAQSIRMHVVGEESADGTTAIYDVEAAEPGIYYIYDLQGRRVLEPKKGGLYIVNNKKVVF